MSWLTSIRDRILGDSPSGGSQPQQSTPAPTTTPYPTGIAGGKPQPTSPSIPTEPPSFDPRANLVGTRVPLNQPYTQREGQEIIKGATMPYLSMAEQSARDIGVEAGRIPPGRYTDYYRNVLPELLPQAHQTYEAASGRPYERERIPQPWEYAMVPRLGEEMVSPPPTGGGRSGGGGSAGGGYPYSFDYQPVAQPNLQRIPEHTFDKTDPYPRSEGSPAPESFQRDQARYAKLIGS